MTAKQIIRHPIDYVAIIQAIVVGVIMILTTWTNLQVKTVSETAERTEKVVAVIKKQTDGSVTASLKALAISAENLAVATKTKEKIKAAEEAWQAYTDRVRVQEEAEVKP